MIFIFLNQIHFT